MSIQLHSVAAGDAYISGDANSDVGVTITGLTVMPGSVAGSIKISQGINGADNDIVPAFNVVEDMAAFHIPFKPELLSNLRTFITMTGTGLQVMVHTN
jgi:hypothetical protein